VRKARDVDRFGQQMNVAGHKYRGVDTASIAIGGFRQGVYVAPIVLFGVEAALAIVSTLYDSCGTPGIARPGLRGIAHLVLNQDCPTQIRTWSFRL